MSVSEVRICNMALAHLGQSDTIGNLETEKSIEATVCRQFYSVIRDATLRAFPWPFAKRKINLALVAQYQSGPWQYVYKYPVDALRLIRLPSGFLNEDIDQRIPYEIQSNETGSLIYTNHPEAQAEVIWRVTDPAFYTPDFVLALSFHLAAMIAPQITGEDPFGMGKRALGSYQMQLSIAQANAINEQQPARAAESAFIRARY